MEKTGRVERRLIAKGTKSERSAMVLETADGVFILRRAQGNPFVDDVLGSLAGQWVVCEGVLLAGSTFEVRDIRSLDKSSEPPK